MILPDFGRCHGFLCHTRQQEMEKLACLAGTETKSQLAVPADWTSSAGNTPYFNGEHLEQIKATSERFRREFPYKKSN